MTKKRNRLIAVGIALLLIIAAAVFIFPAISANADDAWDGTTVSGQLSGEGTEANPYQIANGSDLAYLAQLVNNGEPQYDTYFELTDDIDLGGKDWTPIGSEGSPFTGLFSGDGKTISNLKLAVSGRTPNVGLFGYNSGTIKDVYLADIDISTRGTNAAGLCAINNSGATIDGCAVLSGNIVADNTSWAATGVAGICSSNFGTINRCYNMASVKTNVSGAGVVNANQDGGKVFNCYNAGEVSSIGNGTGTTVGGICSTNWGKIEYCFNYGNVNNADIVGGICGQNDNNKGTISSCYSDSTVCKADAVGNYSTKLTNVEKLPTKELCGDDFLSSKGFGSEWVGGTYNIQRNGSNPDIKFGELTIIYPNLNGVGEKYMIRGEVYNFKTDGADDWQPVTVINDVDGLMAINDNLSGNYVLGDDIDLEGAEWTPIGSTSGAFSGKFSGNGHTIKGVKVNVTGQYDNAGLFGFSTGVIMNVAVEGEISGTNTVGGICGGNSGADGNGIIYACSFKGTVTGTGKNIGGIVGYNFANSKISNCFTAAYVNGANEVGGICGYNEGGATVSNTISVGTVSGSGNLVAGVCGKNDGTLKDNYFDSTVSGIDVGAKDGEGYKVYDGADDYSTLYLCNETIMQDDLDTSMWNFGKSSSTNDSSNARKRVTTYTYPSLKGIAGSVYFTEVKEYNFSTDEYPNWQPYTEIGKAEEFIALGNDESKWGGNYVLTENIDLSGKSVKPIGDGVTGTFKGNFSGDGHTISGVNISSNGDYVGLFGFAGDSSSNLTTIMKLAVEGDITGKSFVGGICGYGNEYVNIFACSFKGSVSGGSCVGGICGGIFKSCYIKNCFNSGAVSGESNVGGLLGYASGVVTVNNSINVGEVSGTTSTNPICGDVNNTLNAENNYYDSTVLGGTASNNVGTAKTTAELCNGSLPAGLDNSIWQAGGITSKADPDYPTNARMRVANTNYPSLIGVGEPLSLDAVKQYNFKTTGTDDDWQTYTEITSADDLKKINDNLSGNYVLMKDINLGNFTPIGSQDTPFTGKFSGNGHKISVSINTTAEYAGIFGYNEGTIMNLAVEGNISGGDYVGSICGYNNGTVYACSFNGSVKGSKWVGGISGYNSSNGTITNCYAIGSVEATDNNAGYAGGICGKNENGNKIEYCYFAGTAAAPTDYNAICLGASPNCYFDRELFNINNYGNDALTTKELCTGKNNSDLPYKFSADIWETGEFSVKSTDGKFRTVSFTYPRLKEGCEAYAVNNVKQYNFGMDGNDNWAQFNEINSLDDLNNINKNPHTNYVLMKDIDLNGGTFSPLVPYSSFWGNFSGNGHTIKNGTIGSGGDFTALFSNNNGLIMNLAVKCDVSGADLVGGICGRNYGTIYGCSFEGSVKGKEWVGGICGQMTGSYSHIINCYVIGSIEATDKAGGILGTSSSSSSAYDTPNIENCYFVGTVTVPDSGKKDAICSNQTDIIKNCYYNSDLYTGSATNGTGKTTAELCNGNLPAGFSNSVWAAGKNDITSDPVDANNERMRVQEIVYPSLIGVGEPYSLGKVKQYNFNLGNNDDWQSYTEINSAADLEKINQNPNGNYVLMKDITLGKGTTIPTFSGKFSGNGHTISGVNISATSENAGLFGENNGLIMYLAVKGNISGSTNVGGICGTNSGTIYGCSFDGSVTGAENVGGISGQNNANSVITNCFTNGTVTCTTNNRNVGGVCGIIDNSVDSPGEISNCISICKIVGYGNAICGNSSSMIVNCFYNTEISSSDDNFGCTGKTTDELCAVDMGINEWTMGSFSSNVDSKNEKFRTVTAVYPKLKCFKDGYTKTMKQYNFGTNGTNDWQEYTEIKNAAEFIAIGNDNSKWNTNYVLTADINLSGKSVKPIGELYNEFKGKFSGDGHTISNVTITGANYVGLFGCSKSKIVNLAVVNGNISGTEGSVGGICGYLENGSIINCSFEGSVKGGRNVGGICGYDWAGTISNCYAIADVVADGTDEYVKNYNEEYAGGICGLIKGFNSNNSNSRVINNCYFVGTVKGDGDGAIFGMENTGGNAGIQNCYYNSDLYTENSGNGTGLSTLEMTSSSALFDEMSGLERNVWKKTDNKAVDSKGQNGIAYYPSLLESNHVPSVKFTASLTFERTGTDALTFLDEFEVKYGGEIKFANGVTVTLDNTNCGLSAVDDSNNPISLTASQFKTIVTKAGSNTYTFNCKPHASLGDFMPSAGLTKSLAINAAKYTLKAEDFECKVPLIADSAYNGKPKQAAVEVTAASNQSLNTLGGYGDITVRYFDSNGKEVVPINAGDYTVKIDVSEGTNCKAATALTADSWKITIGKNIVGVSDCTFSVNKDAKTYTLSVVDLPEGLGEINSLEMTYQYGADGVIKDAKLDGKNIIFTLDGTKGDNETVRIGINSQNYSPFGFNVTANLNDNENQSAPKCEVTLKHDENTGTYTATITAVEGAEYSFDGKTWSDTNTLTGIKHGDIVNASIRMAATADKNASEIVTKTLTADADLKWKSDKDGHWQECSKCDYEETSHSAHIFNGNSCAICGYKKSGGSTGGGGSSSGGGGSYSGGGSSGGGSSRPRNPAVDGKEMTWNDVANEINKLTEGGEATIDLNGNTTVPKDVIKAIADKKALVTIKVNGTFSWTIDGSKLTESDITDMDFKVSVMTASGTETLRGTVGTGFKIENVTDKAVLNITFKAAHSGKFANLYKKVDGKLEFVDNVKIDENGNAIGLEVYEKGEYAVMLGELSDRPGDMDNDGILNAKDALAVLKDFARLITGKNPLVCDLNGDGYVNANDALIILKMAAGLIKI